MSINSLVAYLFTILWRMIPNSNKEKEKGTRSRRQSFNPTMNRRNRYNAHNVMSMRNKSICSKTRSIEEFKPNNYDNICPVPQKNQNKYINAVAPCVVSPEQLVDLVEVLLKPPLDVLQLVVVDGGVAPDADACCQLLHERVHRFVLASRRRPCNAQTPQDCGVDAVAVCLLYTSPSPRDGLLSRMPSSA